jgi:3-phenylpropionate/trans-cinnamate dioxygenase ferredoxin reductase component
MDTSAWETRDERLAIIGGGQAAVQTIDVARSKGYEGAITLVTDEQKYPYQRPPLSKQYLAGFHDEQWLIYRPAGFYTKNAVELRMGERAVTIDRAQRRVVLDDQQILPYDKLVIATGARARALPVTAEVSPRVHSIRNAEIGFSNRRETLRLSVWGHDLTQTQYSIFTFTSAFGDLYSPAPPRTFGVNISFKM